jgi:hypothetical protein
MFLGLGAKLEAARKKDVGVGLIVVDRALQRRKDHVAKLFPDAKNKSLDEEDSDAAAAKYAGILAGQKTELRSGLDKTQQHAALPSSTKQIEFA